MLALAGDSIHWFDWAVLLPRVAGVLEPDGVLAVVHRDWLRDARVRELLAPVYDRYSWNEDFAPLDPVEELAAPRALRAVGEAHIGSELVAADARRDRRRALLDERVRRRRGSPIATGSRQTCAR